MNKMIIVKLDIFPWKINQKEFNFYTPNNDGIIENFKFEVNNNCLNCDFWVIRGDIPKPFSKVKCPPQNIIFITDEPHKEKKYNSNYLMQFSAIITQRKDILHYNIISNFEMVPWLFFEKKYSFLKNSNTIDFKKKEICIISSNETLLSGHRERFAFVNKVIGHFKDRIDVYGRGFKSFKCKYEVLKNYKYSIAIENSVYESYFTEKINECYLADTMPIYFGCPNIEEFYDKESLVKIDINSFNDSVKTIETALKDKLFEKNASLLKIQKEKYLEKYHFPIRLVEILKINFKVNERKKNVKLYSEPYFSSFKSGIFKIKHGVKIVLLRLVTKFLSMRNYSNKKTPLEN